MKLLACGLTAAILLIKIVLLNFKKARLLIRRRAFGSRRQPFDCHFHWIRSRVQLDIFILSGRQNIGLALCSHVLLSTTIVAEALRA